MQVLNLPELSEVLSMVSQLLRKATTGDAQAAGAQTGHKLFLGGMEKREEGKGTVKMRNAKDLHVNTGQPHEAAPGCWSVGSLAPDSFSVAWIACR